jgi:hypothetical protein
MKEDHKNAISFRLGVLPIAINSNLVSAQNRYRLYWTNIEGVEPPINKNIKLKDVLDGWKDSWKIYVKKNASKPKANQDKAGCLTAGKMGDTSDMDIIVYGDIVPCSPSGRVRSKETEHSRRIHKPRVNLSAIHNARQWLDNRCDCAHLPGHQNRTTIGSIRILRNDITHGCCTFGSRFALPSRELGREEYTRVLHRSGINNGCSSSFFSD